MNGWFPKFNLNGDIISGNFGIWITPKGQPSFQKDTVGISPFWMGLNPGYNRNNGTTQVGSSIVNIAYNSYQGSDDTRWAGFTAGQGNIDLYDGIVVTRSIPTGCFPRFYKSEFGYLSPYQSLYRDLVVNGVVVVTDNISEFQLGPELVWQVATGTYTRALRTSKGDVTINNSETPFKVFTAPDGTPWMLTGTSLTGGVSFVRPVYGHMGYVINGELFYPDAQVDGNIINVVGSDNAGNLRLVAIDFSLARTNLTNLTPVPPEPIPPNPEPIPPEPTPIPPEPIPPKPVSPYAEIKEYKIMEPQVVALVGPGGGYVSVNTAGVLSLGSQKITVGADEQFVLSKPDDRFALQPKNNVSSNFLGADATQFDPTVGKQFYLTGARGNYESWFVGTTPEGLIVAFIEYINQGVITKPFPSCALTVVPQ